MAAFVEFDVQMTCQKCVNKIDTALKELDGVNRVEISLEKGSVVVESSLPSSVLLEKIESTGRKAVLKGYGGTLEQPKVTSAAVAMLGGTIGYSRSPLLKGVVRFVQSGDSCVIDGTVDGLSPGMHGLHIHECGDLSQGCHGIGDHFDLSRSQHGGPDDKERHTGDLGNIEADNNGRAQFRFIDHMINVYDIIGRSLVVTDKPDDFGKSEHPLSTVDGNSGDKLACGVISRSAGLFENPKKICACDGVTLWDERDRPLAGPGRQMASSHL